MHHLLLKTQGTMILWQSVKTISFRAWADHLGREGVFRTVQFFLSNGKMFCRPFVLTGFLLQIKCVFSNLWQKEFLICCILPLKLSFVEPSGISPNDKLFCFQTNADVEWKFSRAVVADEYRRYHPIVVPFNIISVPLSHCYIKIYGDNRAKVCPTFNVKSGGYLDCFPSFFLCRDTEQTAKSDASVEACFSLSVNSL